MSGVTDVYVNGGTFATTFSGVGSTPNLHLLSTNVNATVTTTAAAVVGTADAVTILSSASATTANVTATYNGVETVNLVLADGVTGSTTTRLTITSDEVETVNITGGQNAYLALNLDGADALGQVGKVLASAATGNIDVTITEGASGEMSIVGGSGNDKITIAAGALDYKYTIDGGNGTDTLVADASSYSSTDVAAEREGFNVKNFEILSLTAGGTVDIRNFANNTFTSYETNGTGTLNGLGTTAVSLAAKATGSITLDRATDGSADTATITLAAATPGTFAAIDASDEETLTISSGGTAAGSNVITTLTATDATSLTITGNRDLTITNAISGTALATLNASGLSGTGVNLVVDASNSTANMTVTLAAGVESTAGETMNTVTTGSGADTVTGGAYADSITTGAGNDRVTAGGGNDTVTTSFGNDSVDGGDGDDSITDTSGNDTLIGGAGNDTLSAASGADSVSGGEGNDRIYITSLGSNDTVDGGVGTDSLSAAATSTTLAASFYSDVTESSVLNVTGVESAYIQVTTSAADTTTAPLNVDFTSVTGMSTLYLDVVAADDTAVKITNFGGSSVLLTELAAGQDPEFVNIDGADQASLGITVRGFAPTTAANGDVTVTGVTALTITGDSYVSTTKQTNLLGSITADSVDTFTLQTDGTGGYAANTTALTITGTVSVDNAQTVTIAAGASDTLELSGASDIEAINNLVQTATVTIGENGTLTVGGGDINLGTAALNTLTVTNGIGGTISTLDIEAGSAATFTGTLSASSTSALDLNFRIVSGTVTMSTGSAWTLATAGATGANSLTITGYGDVAEGTAITLAGTTFTLNASGLTDADGLTVTGANVTSTVSITGSSGADTITGSAGADTLTGSNGADDIIGGVGADRIVLTENVSAADQVFFLGTTAALQKADAGDTIVGFVTGTDQIVFELDAFIDPAGATPSTLGTQQMVTNMATNANISANTLAFIFQLTGTTDSTTANTTTGAAAALANIDGADSVDAQIIFLLDDGTNTYIWLWDANSGAAADQTVNADELTLLGTISGVTAVAVSDIIGST